MLYMPSTVCIVITGSEEHIHTAPLIWFSDTKPAVTEYAFYKRFCRYFHIIQLFKKSKATFLYKIIQILLEEV